LIFWDKTNPAPLDPQMSLLPGDEGDAADDRE
jgi:hypothetical protein